MNKSQTVTGKVFHYEGDLSQGITVYTSDGRGVINNNSFFIAPETIRVIRKTIITHGEIPMGACRDNPAKDSIGYVLSQQNKSPQYLSYVIPLLTQENLCTYTKRGKAYFVKGVKRQKPTSL